METTIERGIPIPKLGNNGGGSPQLYYFGEMGVGDSFVVTGNIKSARVAACNFARANGVKFVTRKLPDGKGIRIWRIS